MNLFSSIFSSTLIQIEIKLTDSERFIKKIYKGVEIQAQDNRTKKTCVLRAASRRKWRDRMDS